MKSTNLGRPWNWLYNLAGQFGGPQGGIHVIGGSDGPTAIFVAGRRGRRPKLDNGVLCVRLDWREVFAALALALGLVASLALLLFTLTNSSGRNR